MFKFAHDKITLLVYINRLSSVWRRCDIFGRKWSLVFKLVRLLI